MVRVNIYRGAFGGAFDSVEVAAGVPLYESLPAIDWERTIAHNGTIAVNGAYIPSNNETIAMRVYPAAHFVIGTLIAVAVLAVADVITWGITGEHLTYWIKKGLSKLLAPDMDNTSNSQDKDDDLPTLRGAKNKSQDGHPFLFVLGHTRLTPYYVGAPYLWQSGADGETQHYCALYNLGYGKMAVGAIKFGEVDAALNGMVESYVNGGYKLEITKNNKASGMLITGAGNTPKQENTVLQVNVLRRSETHTSQSYLRDSYGRIIYTNYGRPIAASSYSSSITYYWWWLNWSLSKALSFDLTVTCNGVTFTIPKGTTGGRTGENRGDWGKPSVGIPSIHNEQGLVEIKKSSAGRAEFIAVQDIALPDEGGNAKFNNVEIELLEPGQESTLYPQKVVYEELSFELLHPEGAEGLKAERFTATNPQKVQVEIGFNGLFHVNDDGNLENKEAKVRLEYSIDGGKTYKFFGGFTGGKYDSGTGTTAFTKSVRKKMYFTAERTFTYDEAINCTNKVIQLRIQRVDEQSVSTQDSDIPCCTAIRTWRFDRDKSLEAKTLIPQRPMDESKMRLTTRLALRMVATDDLQGTLDELNMMCVAKCRTWDGEAWSAADSLSPTSNPASNVLRLMQSPMLGKKAYNDGMIDMEAFGELYDYCDKMTCNTDEDVIPCPFEVNGALLNKKKLSETVDTMLSTCRAYRTLNGFKYSVFIDKPMNVLTLLLNNHNFLTDGLTNKKEFRDVVDGFRVKFVNENNGFETDELVVMLNGEKSPTPDSIMESIELPWQTNPRQVYMNALFEGGKRKLRPETWTRKVAQEGNLIEIGSLLEIQDDTILVGIGDGAIIKSCLVDYGLGLVKGITVNNPINIDGTAGKYGVRIMRALDGEKPFVGTYEIIVPAEGVFTDTFVFATGAPTDDPRSPMPGDFCSFGELNRETIGAICIGRKENGDGTFDLTLVPYSEALYHLTDGNIPEFDSKLSGIQKEVVEKLPDEYATRGDVARLEALIGGSGIYAPPAPEVTLAEAREEGIAVAHGPLAGGDAVASEAWQIDKGDGEGEHDWRLEASILHFDRKIDGYMEAMCFMIGKCDAECKGQGACYGASGAHGGMWMLIIMAHTYQSRLASASRPITALCSWQ